MVGAQPLVLRVLHRGVLLLRPPGWGGRYATPWLRRAEPLALAGPPHVVGVRGQVQPRRTAACRVARHAPAAGPPRRRAAPPRPGPGAAHRGAAQLTCPLMPVLLRRSAPRGRPRSAPTLRRGRGGAIGRSADPAPGGGKSVSRPMGRPMGGGVGRAGGGAGGLDAAGRLRPRPGAGLTARRGGAYAGGGHRRHDRPRGPPHGHGDLPVHRPGGQHPPAARPTRPPTGRPCAATTPCSGRRWRRTGGRCSRRWGTRSTPPSPAPPTPWRAALAGQLALQAGGLGRRRAPLRARMGLHRGRWSVQGGATTSGRPCTAAPA